MASEKCGGGGYGGGGGGGVVSLGVSAVSKEVPYLYCKPYGKLRIASYSSEIFCKNHADQRVSFDL